MTDRWLSKPAVLWAIYEAEKVPARLLATLIVVAMHTATDGTGAFVSAATVAELTRKTERSAKRDLAELRRLGLIVPGNQKLTAHIRQDRRPFVYNVPFYGVSHTSPRRGHGVTEMVERGDRDGHHGVSHTSPEEVLKTSRTARKRARAGGARASAPGESRAGQDRCGCGAPLVDSTFENDYGEIETFRACAGCEIDPEDCANLRCCEPWIAAPPCPQCGQPFSQEFLADELHYRLAMKGDILHKECAEANR